MSASHSHSEGQSSIWTALNRLIGIALAALTLFLALAFFVSGVSSLGPKPVAAKADAPAAPAAATPVAVPAPATAAPAAAAATSAPAPAAGGAVEVTIKPDASDPTGMKYDVKAFKAKVGQLIKLTFENKHPTLPQPHNVCIGKLGSKATIIQVAMSAATMPDAMAKGFVPETPDIVAHTKLLQPGQNETIEFKLEAAGEYPYICTFPGHGILMNGVITVE